MKLRTACALLLVVCFSALALLSGAVPVVAEASTASAETSPPAAEVDAAPDADADGTSPVEAPAPTPDGEPVPAEEPAAREAPTEPSAPSPVDGVTVLPTTIASDDVLDNDTPYDIDVDALRAEGLDLTLPAEGYQILILHTHTTEAYHPEGGDEYEPSGEYRTTDMTQSVARVGDELASALEAYGLHVLHDASLHDYPSYNGSYARSGETVEEYLAAYPGIRIVIDLHRDALGSGDTIYKTVTEAAGEQAAQIMFVMGTDVNLENPHWQENLRLALAMQDAVRTRYDTLMRPIDLCNYRYNQQLTTGSLLMEVGTAGNSLQEAITAVKLFADAVAPLLLSMVEAA